MVSNRKALERTLERLGRDGLLAPERKRALPDRRAVWPSSRVSMARRCTTSSSWRSNARHPCGSSWSPPACRATARPRRSVLALDRLDRWGRRRRRDRRAGRGRQGGSWCVQRRARRPRHRALSVPTISAVGHEIDTTLCDLVADQRAPTPSAAAEVAVPLKASQEARVRAVAARIGTLARRRLDHSEQRLTHAVSAARRGAARVHERRQARLAHIATRIQALSPLAVLARGYAMALGADGHPLAAAADFTPGSDFDLIVRDGVIRAVASEVLPPRWPTGADAPVERGAERGERRKGEDT